MRHYGIYSPSSKGWMQSYYDSFIFWTTSKAVAEAQLKQLIPRTDSDWEVKEFTESGQQSDSEPLQQ